VTPFLPITTTYPPLWLTNAVTANLTLSPHAWRDTNAYPDVGYHYMPLDYLVSCQVSNATLTLTNGVSVGYFDSQGIGLGNGGRLVSQGTPLRQNIIDYAYSVQEEPLGIEGISQSITSGHNNLNSNPSAYLRFTALYAPIHAPFVMDTDGNNCLSSFTLRDCEVYGAGNSLELSVPSGSVFGLTNNLFHYTQFNAGVSGQFSAFNNLYLGNNGILDYPSGFNGWDVPLGVTEYGFSVVNAGGGSITTRDNVFAGASVTLNGTTGYNGYVNNAIACNGVLSSDIVTNVIWSPGPLGNYYNNPGPFVDKGSRTADLAGLYHYTTQLSEVIESNSVVDIGLHYVAADGNGYPLDTNGDGIPDYLEDPNGNGLVDGNEMDWMDYMPPLTGTSIQVYTPLKLQ
jgi:hypothetical protein